MKVVAKLEVGAIAVAMAVLVAVMAEAHNGACGVLSCLDGLDLHLPVLPPRRLGKLRSRRLACGAPLSGILARTPPIWRTQRTRLCHPLE
mmetsp:Transcript_5151/g.7957  ORF Transcript_5151/g.7957 Transcript_5151/m.7957 type:complete len:90 (+) Transcript_5151:368-637(+)